MNFKWRKFLPFLAILLFSLFSTTPVYAISATSSNPSSDTVALFDGNISTIWNSGGSAPQWILIDLGQVTNVNKLRLLPSQSPAGRTVHKIEAGATATSLSTVLTIYPKTTDNQWIELPLLPALSNVRYIKITTISSPSWVSWREIEVSEGKMNKATHLKFFSYYDTVSDWNWSIENPLGTSYNKVMTMGNINLAELPLDPNGMIDSAAITRVDNILDAYHNAHVKARIAPGWVFFSSYAAVRGGTANLRPDWQVRWAAYKDVLSRHAGDIYCFYFDEPIWNGVTLDQFTAISNQIRADFPNHALMVIEAWPVMRDQSIPAGYLRNITDYGFDFYFSNEEPDLLTGWNRYLTYYDYLKQVSINKHIWVVADGFIGSNSNASKLGSAFDLYLGQALSDPQVVGIMNFLYSNQEFSTALETVFVTGSQYYNGTLFDKELLVGKSITKYAAGDINHDGIVDIFDYNKVIENFGTAGAPGFANSDLDESGRVDIFDYNAVIEAFGK